MVETIAVAPAPGGPMETMSKPVAAKNPEVGGKDSQAGTALECSGRSEVKAADENCHAYI